MGSDRRGKKATTLRDHLRAATSSAHDLLDSSMRPASDWNSIGDYARFLGAQYAARVPVEEWLAVHAPSDLAPPEQTSLLARDLTKLGTNASRPDREFSLSYEGEATALGVSWVLAGSSLGNRAMFRDMQRAQSDDSNWPHEFLSSPAMAEFWIDLRTRVEVAVDPQKADEATRAANVTFEHFLTVSQTTERITPEACAS